MSAPVVAYVLREFPYPSETFIAHEISALERQGVALQIYSYRRPSKRSLHAVLGRIETPVTYLPDPIPRYFSEIRRAHRALHGRDRERYRKVARHALARAAAERDIDALRRFAHAGYLAERLIDSDVRHLHAHFARGATRVAMLTHMLTGLPFSFTAHARDIYTNDVRRPLLREMIERAAFAVTVCEENRAFIQRELHGSPGKIQVVYNGVDLQLFSPDTMLPREDGLVLGAGRLVEKKGFTHLIEAARVLRERGVAFRCEIAGDGPMRAGLETQVRRLGLEERVRFLGNLSQEDLAACYRRARLVALPAVIARNGNRDALPTVLLEAMACGTPVVASRLAGTPEIIDQGVNGLLVEPGDANALARAIEALLGDPSLRLRMGAEARAKAASRFALDENVAALAGLFRQSAGAPAPVS